MKNALKTDKTRTQLETGFVNSVLLTDFRQLLCKYLDCLGQVFVYDPCISRG